MKNTLLPQSRLFFSSFCLSMRKFNSLGTNSTYDQHGTVFKSIESCLSRTIYFFLSILSNNQYENSISALNYFKINATDLGSDHRWPFHWFRWIIIILFQLQSHLQLIGNSSDRFKPSRCTIIFMIEINAHCWLWITSSN